MSHSILLRGAAVLAAAAAPDYPAEIALVLSDEPAAAGLGAAAAAGVAARAVPRRDFPDKAAFEQALEAALQEAAIGLVCLAGFMRVLSPEFCRRWEGRMINIHPSLLPAFPGLDTHARALAAGVRASDAARDPRIWAGTPNHGRGKRKMVIVYPYPVVSFCLFEYMLRKLLIY